MVRLTQVVDRSRLIELQRRLTHALGMSVVFEEPDGSLLNIVGQRGGVCEACTKFIDRDDTGRNKCLYHDSLAANQAQEKLQKSKPGEIVVQFYVCNGKFRNFVIPISIGGEILGNVFCGQFLVQTLKRDDPQFNELMAEMMRFGVTRDTVLSYAKMPDLAEIPFIARENNISTSELEEFRHAYEGMFKKAKPLSYVINAVYLLHEVAQTISLLGNAYYYTNIYTVLSNIIPDELRLKLTDKLEKIRNFIQTIKTYPTVDYINGIPKVNELIFDALSIIEKYESEYIHQLLFPYTKGILPISPPILEFQKKLLIAKVRYNARKARTLLNPILRIIALNPDVFSVEERTLLKEFDSKLTKVETAVLTKPAETIKLFELEDLNKMIDETTEIRHLLVDKALVEPEKHSLDDINNILDFLTNPDFGLQKIRHQLCEERMKGLPTHIANIRHQLRLRYDTVYMNWGGISPTSKIVTEEMNLWGSELDQHGPVSIFTEEKLETPNDIFSQTREIISNFIGCKANEVVLTRNTTHGISLALGSINFSPKGDKEVDWILLTNSEHDTVHVCIEKIEKKFNVKHKILDLSSNLSAKEVAEKIVSNCMERKVKVVILSHITYNTGEKLEIASIIAEVKKKLGRNSPFFLIDGAQAVGHIPVNVSSLDCDFYAADAHKWVIGPKGSGFLYVKESYLEAHKEYFDFYENYMVVEKYRPRDESGRIREPATIKDDIYVGMKRAIEIVLEAQKETTSLIYERIKSLSKKFRQLIKNELKPYGVYLINPVTESGIVTLAVVNQHNFEFYNEMRSVLDRKFHIISRALLNPPAIRFCIHYLNSEWEVIFAVKAIKSFLEEKIPLIAEIVAKKQDANLLYTEFVQKIEDEFASAKNIASERHRLAIQRFTRFEVEESKKIYNQIIRELDNKKLEYLEKAKNLKSKREMQTLEDEMKVEITQILYGK